MKQFLLQYKPFLVFLSKFALVYLLLTLVYQLYLNRFDAQQNQVDSITVAVGNQTSYVMQWFGDSVAIDFHDKEPALKLFYNHKWVSRVIEGCNAISVMILFVSFVIAFSGTWKKTVFFILFGLLLIHVCNIARIALLSMSVYYYPQYQDFLHAVIFPLIIYGVVFVLWVIWVNKFSNYATA